MLTSTVRLIFWHRDEIVSDGKEADTGPAMHAGLAVNVQGVGADGRLGDAERAGDRPIAAPCCQQPQDVDLTIR